MTAHIVVEYEANRTEKEASDDYIGAAVGADEAQTLTAPLAARELRPTDRKQNIAVSVRFVDPGDSCDIMVVTWQKKKPASGSSAPGTDVPLGFFKATAIADAAAEDEAGNPMAQTLLFDTNGARSYEVRITNQSGAGDVVRVKTWTF